MFSASTVPSPGVLRPWPDSEVPPVPLLSSPDLDSLCDPVTPILSNSFNRSSPPRSATLPLPALSAPSGICGSSGVYLQLIDKLSYMTNLFRCLLI